MRYASVSVKNSWLPQSRAERLVATGRLVLAVASLAAIYLDPFEPARHAGTAYALLAIYTIYAAALVVVGELTSGTWFRWQVTTHIIDLAVFSAINYLTEGPTSPFYVYFVFSIVCAILRFGRKGTIATAGVAIAFFAATGIQAQLGSGLLELNRFIIRSTYLGVIAILLIYLSEYLQRITSEVSQIATWSRTRWQLQEDLIERLLAEAAAITGVRRLILAYEHGDERVAYSGRIDDGFTCTAYPPEVARALLADRSGTSTMTRDIRSAPAVTVSADGTLDRTELSPLPVPLVEDLSVRSVIATPFDGEFVVGRMYFLDRGDVMKEDVDLAKIVATIVAGRLDHLYAAEQFRRGDIAEERVRVARDLHDSVLQALTGVSLQLQSIPAVAGRDPAEATLRLRDVQQTIASTQRELRCFIEQLRPDVGARAQLQIDDRLESLSQRFEKQWNLRVSHSVDPMLRLLPRGLQSEIYNLMSEAVANVAKHAGARNVALSAAVYDDEVTVAIEDDGKGFPFTGSYNLVTLNRLRRGPITLKERLAELSGDMLLVSSPHGSRLEMRVPIDSEGGSR
jgi:signal transduction histidine kinase